MTCKDCIHYVWCKDTIADENWTDEAPKEIKKMFSPKCCENFKNKSDFVEVVRCKDCKHYKPYAKPVEDFDGECIVRECETDENEFCSYGERGNK